ncbi:hypothetical protein niasHS_009579 [Heterodera schachtii]|uniref:Uncharacterized protein n=1 Tax=Heterodera schachtii TaxID=97005 RepID=A0ABD2JB40_HETSC
MAATVASIVLQLLILGTVVHLSYEFECTHSFRHANHNNGDPFPPGFKEIFENKWHHDSLKDYNAKDHEYCRENHVHGCNTLTCTQTDGSELFRINGCQSPSGVCSPDDFKPFCNPPNIFRCTPSCQGAHCNNKKELIQPPQPKKNTLTIHIESMPISGATGAMPTTAIRTASAKLIIAIICNGVLLLTMRGHHNAGKKRMPKNMAIVQIQ